MAPTAEKNAYIVGDTTLSAHGGRLLWKGPKGAGHVTYQKDFRPTKIQEIHPDGHRLLIRMNGDFYGDDFSLLLWDSKAPNSPAVEIANSKSDVADVGFPLETISGDYVTWMAAKNHDMRRIMLLDVSTMKREVVAQGLVYHPQITGDILVWQQQDSSGRVSLQGIHLHSRQRWTAPPQLASLNANSRNGYLIGPSAIAWGTEVTTKDETSYQLWVWRIGWTRPLLVETGEVSQHLMGWHKSLLAYRPSTPDAGYVLDTATGAISKVNSGWAQLSFDSDTLVMATPSGTEHAPSAEEVRIPVSQVPTQC